MWRGIEEECEVNISEIRSWNYAGDVRFISFSFFFVFENMAAAAFSFYLSLSLSISVDVAMWE
jgi:hypothetical protein